MREPLAQPMPTEAPSDAILKPSSRQRLGAAGALVLAAAALLAAGAAAPSVAQTGPSAAELFAGADLAEGERLIAEHKCSACHIRRVGGDGSAIYQPKGRINTPSALRGMVQYCATELNLALFPEDVTAVAAVLNRDHYRFK